MITKSQITINLVIEINESEARALDALAGYGPDSFLEVFYKQLGKYYMAPHEYGLRTLFGKIRTEIPSQLSKIDKAREAVKYTEDGMRNIRKLIEDIKLHIPEDGYKELILRLDKCSSDSVYAAPENPIYFDKVSMALTTHLSPIDTEWKQKIANIFSGKE